MGDETLQEYLVKIGWDLDKDGYNNVQSLINGLINKIGSKVGNFTKSFLTGAGIVKDAIVGITESTVELINKTAQLDKETEKWARQYWTTEQNARSLQSAMKSMGLSSLDDLYYATSEEYNRFLDLRNLGKSLEAPKELDDFLVKVRDINHEVNRLKVIFEYGARWVVYYLGKMFGKDTDEMLQLFKNGVDWIAKHLPQIAEKIAKAISHVVNIVLALYKVGKAIVTGIKNHLDSMPSRTKATLAALSAVLLAFLAGPVGKIIAGITILLLLLEDFYVWSKGGKSLFDYSKLEEFFNSPGIQKIRDFLESVFEILGGIIEYIAWLVGGGEMSEWARKVDEFLESVYNWLGKILSILNLIFGKKTGDPNEDTWIGRAGQIASTAAEYKNDDTSWMNKNPLLQAPSINGINPTIVDNSKTDVNIGISYDKDSDTFKVSQDIVRNTNFNNPILSR